MLVASHGYVSAATRHFYPSLYSVSQQRLCCSKLKAPSAKFSTKNINVARISGTIRAASDGDLSAQSSSPSNENTLQTVAVEKDGISVEGVIQFDKRQPPPWRKWRRVAILAGGDILGLLLFSAIGRINHGMPVLDWETLHTADPFVAGWLLSAYFLGGFESEGLGMSGALKAAVTAIKSWAIGIPLGLAIRGVTAGHFPAASFILVSMGSTFILLVGWRTVFTSVFPNDEQSRKKREIYRQGSPLEFFELLTSLVRRW